MKEHDDLISASYAIREVASKTGLTASEVIEIAKILIEDDQDGVYVIGSCEVNYVYSVAI